MDKNKRSCERGAAVVKSVVDVSHGRSELDAKVAHHHCQFVGCAPWSQKSNTLT